MASIKRSSMKDQVYEIIRDRIFSSEYQFGEEIRILSLSKELGISNTPIREALNMLVAEGLLTCSLNNKFRVLEMNEALMSELNEAVCILLTAGFHAAHKDGRDANLLPMLEEALAAQKKALSEGDEYQYILQTMRFDRCFIEITGNDKLISVYDNFNNLLYLYVRHTYWKEQSNLQKKLHEHELLIDAVRAKDSAAVVEQIEQHFDEHYVVTTAEGGSAIQ